MEASNHGRAASGDRSQEDVPSGDDVKPRDIFDIAVVKEIEGGLLIANLGEVASRKDDLVRRLANIRVDYLKADLAELDIQPGWEHEKETCLETVRSLVTQIPEAG